jgi:2-succinyl-5-enolpyruvyl-6-hydroxy-3-cyclohexene-1-carboxylate synthase
VWLQQQQNIMVKDANGVERRKNIQNYRKEYLEKWCGYEEKPQKTNNDRILEKAQSAFSAEELAAALKALK